MRLHPRLISYLAESITADLQRDKLLAADGEDRLAAVIANQITEELEREDKLNEEVRALLAKHYEQVRSSGAEYDQLFKMVKAKLAKEKGIIL
jgi:hypothetical protein